ncbi:hypothetical protein Cgig2_008959 [Carnegiea gigantea]|uniref:Uncharacterized protein n=1 Tax=Carnegiea gigantea TaxID=171969 RepID=A0A9Q1K868_9CARY|nr:hypothetical protein Cgig2_008959 [Carnegiea gigantea]
MELGARLDIRTRPDAHGTEPEPITAWTKLVKLRQPEREGYVTVDALKNLMSTITDTIMQQMTKQVKKAMEAASSARPLPHFNHVPTTGYKPSHRRVAVVKHRHSDEVREVVHPDRDGRSQGENRDRSIGADALQNRRPSQGRPAKSTTASTAYATHSPHTAWFKEQKQTLKPRGEASGRRRTPEH